MNKTKWTIEKIISAYNTYLKSHKYLPTARDLAKLNRKDMPLVPTIKRTTGLSLSEFYKTYFPEYSFAPFYDGDLLQDFLSEYKRLNYPTQVEYDKKRQNTPSSQYILTHLNCKWSDIAKPKREKTKHEFKVVITHSEKKHNLEYIINELDKILTHK